MEKIGGIKASQVYIVCGYKDMRRSIDGLAAIVKQNYGMDPNNGRLFLFCDRRRDRIGMLSEQLKACHIHETVVCVRKLMNRVRNTKVWQAARCSYSTVDGYESRWREGRHIL